MSEQRQHTRPVQRSSEEADTSGQYAILAFAQHYPPLIGQHGPNSGVTHVAARLAPAHRWRDGGRQSGGCGGSSGGVWPSPPAASTGRTMR